MAKRILHDKHVATYLLRSDFDRLDKIASEQNMSVSSLVREILKRYLRRTPTK